MKPVSIYPESPYADEPLMLDIRAVADLLTVSVRTVERMIQSGEFFQAVTLNRRNKRWSRVAVEQWISDRQAAAVDDVVPATLSLVSSKGN
jgi:predicted DNA-binding transcriptional regulator AlpA